MGKARLLVVEDDIDIGNMLKIYFSGMEFDVDVAMRGKDALEKTRQVLPHLIVLDIMLPDIDGYEVCRNLRTNMRTSHIPVIFLTQKDERSDKLQGLELGADDYITKPFSPRELVSRVKAVIRRTEGASGSMHDIIEVDDRLRIDFDRREIWLEGKLVKLRPTEYRLLYHLVQNAGWVVTHDQLLVKVWGYEYRDEPHYVRLYINYLRQKLEKDPANPKYILTERGVGYRFVDYKRQKAESK
jgi:two-component system KDP operon response regulator KdpE